MSIGETADRAFEQAAFEYLEQGISRVFMDGLLKDSMEVLKGNHRRELDQVDIALKHTKSLLNKH